MIEREAIKGPTTIFLSLPLFCPHIFLPIIFLCFDGPKLHANDVIEIAFPDLSAARGVVVVAGVSDARPVIALAKAAPAIVLTIASDEEKAEKLASNFRKAGVYGQVTTALLGKRVRIALADNSVATFIADLDAIDGLATDEALRLLRPFGRLYLKKDGKWQQPIKPRPVGMDDWASYDKDERASQHSNDTHAGPPRGLQWIAVPTNQQSYTLIKNETALAIHHKNPVDLQSATLMARDAFSGLPLWERLEFTPRNRFAVVLGDKHIILHPHYRRIVAPHTIALNRQTGETVMVYREGIDCNVTKEEAKNDRQAYSKQAARTEDLQLRLVDGLLIQILREEIVVLDEATGKRKWSRKAKANEGFVHPVCSNGSLYIVESQYQRHSSYTHWPMGKPLRIVSLSLANGSERWTLDWDEAKFGKAHAVYNLQLEGDRLGGAVTIYLPNVRESRKPRPHGLILNATNGEVIYWGREELSHPESRKRYAWPGQIGAGHSHVRLHLRGDTAWTAVLGSPIAYWPIDRPKDFTCFAKLYSPKGGVNNLRSVSCTVGVAHPSGGLAESAVTQSLARVTDTSIDRDVRIATLGRFRPMVCSIVRPTLASVSHTCLGAKRITVATRLLSSLLPNVLPLETHSQQRTASNAPRWHKWLATMAAQPSAASMGQGQLSHRTEAALVLESRQLIRQLERAGVFDDTLIVFVSDNGFRPDDRRHDRANQRSKLSVFEDGIRTPILISWKNKVVPGEHEQLVQTVDLVPSILTAVGLSKQRTLRMKGIDLMPSARGESKLPNRPAFGAVYPYAAQALGKPSQHVRARWVRHANFKLIVPGPAKPALPLMLFDLKSDPMELTNLASSPLHVDKVTELRTLLDRW